MRLKSIYWIFFAFALCVVPACGGDDPVVEPDVLPIPDPLPVDPDTVPESPLFTLGADISWLTEMENSGRKLYADSKMGTPVEGTALMQQLGCEAIRLRVWVDPANKTTGYVSESASGDGKSYCDKADVVEKAMRAQALGMNIMIDFHYSDSWADPVKQYIPDAWKNYTYEQLVEGVKSHTQEVLSALKEAGVTNVKWVQVGNETHPGMLCYQYKSTSPVEQGGYFEKYPAHYAGFIDAGYETVKGIYPEALVVVHHDKSNNWALVKKNLDVLKQNNARFDMVGLSFYPCDIDSSNKIKESTTSNNISQAFDMVKNIYDTYEREVMFVELGMKMWPEENIATSAKLMKTIVSQARTTEHCRGLFYWEPMAWWWSNYNMGAFNVGDKEGKKLYPNAIFTSFTEKQ